MFVKLLIKEWREKAALGLFGLLVLAAFVPAYIALAGKKDALDWLTYGLVLILFPFVALLLGSAAFETEHRNDAWSFLLSRPVAKPVAWAAKYLALLAILGALWLAFAVLWFVLPRFQDLVGTTRAVLGFGLETGFPWLSVLASIFLMTVSFALSMVSEKPFSTVFASLILGGGFLVLVYAVLQRLFRGIFAWSEQDRALSTFELAMGLMTLAVGAASALTFVRADFSQPGKKAARLSTWTAALLVPVLLVTGVWAFLGPSPGPRYVSYSGTIGGEPLFESGAGIFKYSAKKDKIQWLTKFTLFGFFRGFGGGGTKQVYCTVHPKRHGGEVESLWSLDVATLEKHQIVGQGPEWQRLTSEVAFWGGIATPDGTSIVLSSVWGRRANPKNPPPPLFIINADGSGFKALPVDPELAKAHASGAILFLRGFTPDGKILIMEQYKSNKPPEMKLWAYDLEKQVTRLLLSDYGHVWKTLHDGFVVFRRRVPPGDRPALSLLDVRTMAVRDLCTLESGNFLPLMTWNAKGDRLLFLRNSGPRPDSVPYTLTLCSFPDGKIVAEKTLTGFAENQVLLFSPEWLADDSGIALNSSSGLRVLSPDLREQRMIAYPPALRNPVGIFAAESCFLIQDQWTDSLWRYDLKNDSWKRVY